MIVRELRSEKTHSVCPEHFYGRLAPPPGMPLLGVVVDARTHQHECEWCALQQCLPAARREPRALLPDESGPVEQFAR